MIIFLNRNREINSGRYNQEILCPFCCEDKGALTTWITDTVNLFAFIPVSRVTTGRSIMFPCCDKGIKVKAKYLTYAENHIDEKLGFYYAIIKTLKEKLPKGQESEKIISDYISKVKKECNDIESYLESNKKFLKCDKQKKEKNEVSILCIWSFVLGLIPFFVYAIPMGIAGFFASRRDKKRGSVLGLLAVATSIAWMLIFFIMG